MENQSLHFQQNLFGNDDFFRVRCASCDEEFNQTEARKKQSGNYCQKCCNRINRVIEYREKMNILERLIRKSGEESDVVKDKKASIDEFISKTRATYGIEVAEEARALDNFIGKLGLA